MWHPGSLWWWQFDAVMPDDMTRQAQTVGFAVAFGISAESVFDTNQVLWCDHSLTLLLTGRLPMFLRSRL